MTAGVVGDVLEGSFPAREVSDLCHEGNAAASRNGRLRASGLSGRNQHRTMRQRQARASRLLRRPRKGGVMRRRLHEGRWDRRVAFAVAATVAATFAGATGAARAADAPQCPTSPAAAYNLQLKALTGPAGADLTISVTASPGCVLPGAFKSIQLKTFRADGSLMRTRNHIGVDAPGGVAKDIPLGSMPRRSRVVADITFETDTPAQ